jgi:hypothetical protein
MQWRLEAKNGEGDRCNWHSACDLHLCLAEDAVRVAPESHPPITPTSTTFVIWEAIFLRR